MQQHSLAWNRAALRVQLSLLLLSHLHRKARYNPDQPRDRQGRWTAVGESSGAASNIDDVDSGNSDDSIVIAGYSFGTLIAQSPAGLGTLKCFYQFSFGVVAVDGPVLGGCPPFVPSSAVTHGNFFPNPANDR